MNQNYYQDEVEIDLIQFCKRLLVQWRAVVAVALVFGILVMCGKYIMDVKHFKAEKATGDSYSIESTVEKMDTTDYNTVVSAVKFKEQLDEWNEYLDNSLYMDVNPISCEQVRLLYKIETDGGDDASDVIAAFRESLLSDEILTQIVTSAGIETDNKYLREIISVDSLKSSTTMEKMSEEQSETIKAYVDDDSLKDVLLVSATVPRSVDSNALRNALRDAVDSCAATVGFYGYSYRIDFVSDTITVVSDVGVLQSQNKMMEQYDKVKSYQKSVENGLSEEQKKLYKAMLIVEGEEADDTNQQSLPSESSIVPSMSSKYFVVGALLGIFIYAGVFFSRIILSSYVVETAVFSVTGMPSVGSLQMSNKKKGVVGFLTHDSKVYNLLYKEAETSKKTENIVAQMLVYAGNKDEKKFQILQSGFDVSNEGKISELKSIASKQGIELLLVSLDLADINDSLTKIDVSVPSVLAVYENKTLKKDVRTLYEMLLNQKARVVGELYIF